MIYAVQCVVFPFAGVDAKMINRGHINQFQIAQLLSAPERDLCIFAKSLV